MKINFLGDFVANRVQGIGISEALQARVDGADYTVVNFEAPVATEEKATLKSGPSLQQDVEAPAWLKRNGFDVFTLANNHIMDYGERAARKTVEVLGREATTGIGLGEEAYRPLVLEKDGIRVALLSLAELQFGMVHDSWSAEEAYGCAWINHPCVNRVVGETRGTVDFLIVVAHAGLEGYDVPLPEWRLRYRELIDLGADAIVGGHTHTAQGYEVYKGKPIFYSLGNFCFPRNRSREDSWNLGEGVTLNLSKDGGAAFSTFGTRLVDDRTLEMLPEAEWNAVLGQLNAALQGEGYIRHVDDIALHAMDGYNCLFDMGGYIHVDRHIVKSVARWLLGRCRDVHALNNLQCESHRWTIARALRLKNKL